MAIYGLEDDYYCAYTPIPVRVSPEMYPNMTFNIQAGSEVLIGGRMYQRDGLYYLDLSAWVKIFMHQFNDTRTYNKLYAWENINDQQRQVTINFVEDDGLGGNTHLQSITKWFVKCALYERRYIDSWDRNIRVWSGYPYSWHRMSDNGSLYAIPSGDTPPAVSPWKIEYIKDMCRGSYMKWLNEYGYYNYWLFPNVREEVFSGENIFDVPRDIFDENRNSNFDTVGFRGEDKFTVRDMVKVEYWHLFKSLATSPEVYILKDSWFDAYQAGATTLAPDWWIKVRQVNPEVSMIKYKRNMAEIELEFEYPKPYSQTLI